jgi:hypothetical protein
VDEDGSDDNVLDYAKPPPPQPPLWARKTRDTSNYYREPPSLEAGVWMLAMVLIAVVAMILFCAGDIRLPVG